MEQLRGTSEWYLVSRAFVKVLADESFGLVFRPLYKYALVEYRHHFSSVVYTLHISGILTMKSSWTEFQIPVLKTEIEQLWTVLQNIAPLALKVVTRI
jgi:hypothetical protein